MSDKRYKVKYKIDTKYGDFTKDEIIKSGENFGGADALFCASILRQSDKSIDCVFFSLNELGGAMEPIDEFKIWTLFTARLASVSNLPPALKSPLVEVFNKIQNTLQADKGGELFISHQDESDTVN